MSIDDLLKHHDELVADITRKLAEPDFDVSQLQRPIEVRMARAQAVRARIEALDRSKAEFVVQVDAQVATLRAELAALEADIKKDRDALAPLVAASNQKPPARETRARSNRRSRRSEDL